MTQKARMTNTGINSPLSSDAELHLQSDEEERDSEAGLTWEGRSPRGRWFADVQS